MKSFIQKSFWLILFSISIVGYIFIIHKMMFLNSNGGLPESEEMKALQFVGTLFLILSILSISGTYYFLIIKSRRSDLIKNWLLSILVLFILFCITECVFLHMPVSNAIGERWSYKLWDRIYMNHRTSFFYKDSKNIDRRADLREPFPTSKWKKKIWFIGDSFTFGFGIEKTSETFPAVVERQLQGKYSSVNLGDGGAATFKEKETLIAYNKTIKEDPALVVWQYFGNDIDIKDDGPNLHEKELNKSKFVRFGQKFFRAKSFLLDYIYWEYFTGNESGSINTYTRFLNKLYKIDSLKVNGTALKDSLGYITPYRHHLEPIKNAALFYKSKGVNFLVVIFPFLWEGGPENAEKLYANRIEKELKKEGMDVINLTPLLKNIPPQQRVVNIHDPHPSVLVAGITGDTIAKYCVSKYGL